MTTRHRLPGRASSLSTIAVLSVVATLVCPLLGATSASAATTAPPDMKILVPTKLISIGSDPTNGHRQLRYTHITEDAGTGPFEIDPTYNTATGISTFVQSLYDSPSPGVWTVDHTIPLGVNGAFVNGSDYRFPLTRFTLNGVNPDGSIGPVVAVSPKTDYCITGDNRVGDVPNTPAQTSPPADNCSDPTRTLGWSVGWGDQYDQTDSGQPIDINGVADGTYILRAIVDPQHVLTESDATNNVTDTMLTIAGTSVTVGTQTQPVVTAPSIAITGPVEGASVSGTVDLTVNTAATSPATVVGVQYLLDGNPLGSRQTTAPFSFSWTVGSTPAGSHRITAQATDSTGSIGTAPVVTVTVPPAGLPGGFAVDQTVNRTGHGAVTTSAFSTAAPGESLLAYVAADGPNAGGAQSATVSGAGLSWGLVKRSNGQPGDAEIWTATAAGTLAGATVTSTLASAGFDQQLTVVTYAGAAGVGSSAVGSAATGAPSVGLTASAAGSLVYGVGNDYDSATARTVGAGQSVVNQWLDTLSGDTFWAQRTVAGSTAAGRAIAIDDPAPSGDHWNLAAAEIKPGGNTPPDTTPPTVSITNPVAGQIVSGTNPVAAAASDNVAVAAVQFLLDGQPLGGPQTAAPYSVAWDTTGSGLGTHTLSARATDLSGNTGTAAPVAVTVQNPAPPMTCFVLQAQKSVHGRGAVSTPALSTAMPNETLVAFVATDGPMTAGGQSATISSAGLTWRLVKRSNAQFGDSEVWTATAPAIGSNVTVRSAPGRSGYDQDLTVIAMEGAAGVGASASGSGASGAPTLNLTTTAATALVFAVGNDWDAATGRTLPAGRVMLDQWLDTATGDTMWSEYTNQAVSPQGRTITIGATAPTNHRWNLVAVELRGDDA